MKKFFSCILAIAMSLAVAACGTAEVFSGHSAFSESVSASSSTVSVTSPDEGTIETSEKKSNVLIAYFSRTGENYAVGRIETGNTHIVADMIAAQTGGDLFEISTVTPYPEDYAETVEIASQEKAEDARPELRNTVENMDDYDVVFIGYPIWHGDIPMAVYTFLESYDFTGKTVIPFCTHAGSGLAGTESSMQHILRTANFKKGLAVRGTTAQNDRDAAQQQVDEWLRSILT